MVFTLSYLQNTVHKNSQLCDCMYKQTIKHVTDTSLCQDRAAQYFSPTHDITYHLILFHAQETLNSSPSNRCFPVNRMPPGTVEVIYWSLENWFKGLWAVEEVIKNVQADQVSHDVTLFQCCEMFMKLALLFCVCVPSWPGGIRHLFCEELTRLLYVSHCLLYLLVVISPPYFEWTPLEVTWCDVSE